MTPVKECGVVECSVCAAEWHAAVLHFKMATRCKCFEHTGENGGDIFEAVHEGAAVDVVEWLREEPLFFCVVDLENAICGDTGGVSPRAGQW